MLHQKKYFSADTPKPGFILFTPNVKVLVWFLALLKIILVAQNEIVALPNDSAVFVNFALFRIADVGPPVGYPLWLLAVKSVGLPQRIAIELFYLYCCFYLVKEVGAVLGKYCSLMLIFVLFFSPVSFHLFDNALSDALYVCLVLLCLGLSVRLIRGVDDVGFSTFLSLGIVLGFIGTVRSESEIIMAWLAWLAIFLVWRMRKLRLSKVQSWVVVRSFLFVVGVVVLLNLAPAAFHRVVQGVWVKTLPSLPSHMSMLANLAAIDVNRENIPRVSVSKDARLNAYAVSPSLALLERYIEDEKNMYVAASRDSGLPAGEIGNGWIWHVFNDAALQALPNPRTLVSLDIFWEKVNAELEAAYVSGKLTRRSIVHPLVSGTPFAILKSLPMGMVSAYESVFAFMPDQLDQQFSSDEFDALALRRRALVERKIGNLSLRGWVANLQRDTLLTRVQVGVESQRDASEITWVDAILHPRSDVDSSLALQFGRSVNVVGFEVKNVIATHKKFRLKYFTNHGVLLDEDNRIDIVRGLRSADTGEFVAAVDQFRFSGDESNKGRRAAIQKNILDWTGWVVIQWTALAVVSFALLLAGGNLFLRRASRISETSTLLVFVVGLIFQRLVFYGVLDRFAWAIEPRYVAPVFALIVFSVVLAARSFWLYARPENH